MTRRSTVLALLTSLLVAVPATGQDWRGLGRVGGKVVDDSGKPLEGVAIRAMLPSAGNKGPDTRSNAKGEWAIGGVARGDWALDFAKDGYETKRISISISEVARIPPMEVALTKKAAPAPDPNTAIKEKLIEAAALMTAKRFAQARAVYEELAAAYPEVKQFRPLIARTYHGEGNTTEAIAQLRQAVAQDPENVEVKLLLSNLLMEDGKDAAARELLDSVDESRVTDPNTFVNVGIALINDGKHGDAVPWFDKAIDRFPQQPDAYYYRGISRLSLGQQAEAKADLQKYVSLAPPDAPELPLAKKILESMGK